MLANAAQAGMRVNEARAAQRDHEVVLRRSGRDENEVASRDRAGRG